MKLFQKLNISQKLLKAVVLKKKVPIVIGWNITYRCNLRCQYCGYPSIKVDEMKTNDIFQLIDEMTHLGTKIIVFSGGEPLLRDDLGEIIAYCRKKGIYVAVNSNGTLIKQKTEKIRMANEIQLSLDGPEDVNDVTRGKGVYGKVLEAIEVCQHENIRVNITTVLSKYNISSVEHLLEIAKKYNVGITFQPVGKRFSGDTNSYEDHPAQVGPDKNDFKQLIAYLISEKIKGNKFINNSFATLNHFTRGPNCRKMNCMAHFISCSIEPNGKIFTCDMFPDYQKYLIPGREHFKESFESLDLPHTCEGFCNGPLQELNLMKNFGLGSMMNIWKRFRNPKGISKYFSFQKNFLGKS